MLIRHSLEVVINDECPIRSASVSSTRGTFSNSVPAKITAHNLCYDRTPSTLYAVQAVQLTTLWILSVGTWSVLDKMTPSPFVLQRTMRARGFCAGECIPLS